VLPLWNPHQFCGNPFAANGQSAVFYPPNLIFAILPPELALGWSAAFHLFAAGLFAFLLIRELGARNFGAYVGGVTYAFGAFMVTWLELPTLVDSATWLPLVLFFIHRAAHSGRTTSAVGAGLALAMAVLAGHMQIAFYVFVMAAAWWAWLILFSKSGLARQPLPLLAEEGFLGDSAAPRPRTFALAVLSLAIALLIAAPQILPTVELARLSHRVREVSASGFSRYQANAIPARNLVTAFVPDFYGSPASGDYVGPLPYAEYAFYAGVMPLMLGILGTICALKHVASSGTSGRDSLFFILAAVLSLLSAFGTPINALFYYIVPGFSALGGPNRIVVLWTLSIAVLSGVGADWFAGRCASQDSPARGCDLRSTFRAALIGIGAMAVLCAAAFCAAAASLASLGVGIGGVLAQARPHIAEFAGLFAVGAALLLLRGSAKVSRQLFSVLTFLLVAILGTHFSSRRRGLVRVRHWLQPYL